LTAPTGGDAALHSLLALEYARSNAGATTNNGTWQDGPEFTGLEPNTQYSFFARYKANATMNNASAPSLGLSVTTALPQQSGAPEFTGGEPATVGIVMTVGPGTLTVTTNLTYTWHRSDDGTVLGDEVGTGPTYTPHEDDIDSFLVVVATTTDAQSGGQVQVATAAKVVDDNRSSGAMQGASFAMSLPAVDDDRKDEDPFEPEDRKDEDPFELDDSGDEPYEIEP
jgi:hypothetical protein